MTQIWAGDSPLAVVASSTFFPQRRTRNIRILAEEELLLSSLVFINATWNGVSPSWFWAEISAPASMRQSSALHGDDALVAQMRCRGVLPVVDWGRFTNSGRIDTSAAMISYEGFAAEQASIIWDSELKIASGAEETSWRNRLASPFLMASCRSLTSSFSVSDSANDSGWFI